MEIAACLVSQFGTYSQAVQRTLYMALETMSVVGDDPITSLPGVDG